MTTNNTCYSFAYRHFVLPNIQSKIGKKWTIVYFIILCQYYFSIKMSISTYNHKPRVVDLFNPINKIINCKTYLGKPVLTVKPVSQVWQHSEREREREKESDFIF